MVMVESFRTFLVTRFWKHSSSHSRDFGLLIWSLVLRNLSVGDSPVPPCIDVLCILTYEARRWLKCSSELIFEASSPDNHLERIVLKLRSTLPFDAPSLTAVCDSTMPSESSIRVSCSLE